MNIIDQQMQIAVSRHCAGRFDEAEAAYRMILQRAPTHFDACHNLGLVLYQTNRIEEAVEQLRRAIELSPADCDAHFNLGLAFQSSGKFDQAITAYQRVLALDPSRSDAQNNLGNVFLKTGQFTSAIESFRTVLSRDPSHLLAYNNLGNACHAVGRYDEAIVSYRRALCLDPNSGEAHLNLGISLAAKGEFQAAIASYHSSLLINPASADAWNNLGIALQALGDDLGAITAFEHVLKGQPDHVKALVNRGASLHAIGRLDDAVEAYRLAVLLDPSCAEAHNNLANVCKDQGRLDLAADSFHQAVLHAPTAPDLSSNVVYSRLFDPVFSAGDLLAHAREWAGTHAPRGKYPIPAHANDPAPGKRLRIGYVSPDFCHHVVGRNLLPLLRTHDRQAFEVFCYSNTLRSDSITKEIHEAALWRDIAALDDDRAAALIRDDGIDILIDLALHTARNRLLVFARKPAPVQVTYLGYCGTTGLDTMDYRLSDHCIDPADADVSCYSERTYRLPHCYWCYQPPAASPEVRALPALALGAITFGCLNNFAKVSGPAFELWIELLRKTPRSRLLLNAPAGSSRARVQSRLHAAGISMDRIEFVATQGFQDYLHTWQRIDIGLDPFPYGGGITTCDAIWMGVPVISLAGRTSVGRGGKSILSNLGLPDLVAESPLRYVEITAKLANDLPRLSELRLTMRERLRRSPIADLNGFIRDLEMAYRGMWSEWCTQSHAA